MVRVIILSEDNQYILKMEKITKKFPGVLALNNVDFFIKKGEIHCLVGENGAGKSTLIKILAGALKSDSGSIFINGGKCIIDSTHKAQSLGIGFVFQEINVIDQLKVFENISLGKESKKFCFLNKRDDYFRAKKYLDELEIDIDPNIIVRSLSIAMKQIIGIAKALSMNPSIIVMDEPSSSLTEKELDILFKILKKLKEKGVTVIYISHRIDEIFTLGDTVTVLKDGAIVGSNKISDISRKDLVKLMVGKQFKEVFPKKNVEIGKVVLELRNITGNGLKNINLKLRQGEILGITGLQGSGRTEIARIIFGADKFSKGEMILFEKELSLNHPKEAIDNNIGLVPEERRSQGIIGILSVMDNILLASHRKVSRYGFLNFKKINVFAENFIKELDIKTPTKQQRVMLLSGGNQQKVVIAKWLCVDSEILLLDEPTRGIDVGAKFEIFKIISNLSKQGKSIIIFSSELEELVGMCNRIIILKKGEVSGELKGDEINQGKIIQLAG